MFQNCKISYHLLKPASQAITFTACAVSDILGLRTLPPSVMPQLAGDGALGGGSMWRSRIDWLQVGVSQQHDCQSARLTNLVHCHLLLLFCVQKVEVRLVFFHLWFNLVPLLHTWYWFFRPFWVTHILLQHFVIIRISLLLPNVVDKKIKNKPRMYFLFINSHSFSAPRQSKSKNLLVHLSQNSLEE